MLSVGTDCWTPYVSLLEKVRCLGNSTAQSVILFHEWNECFRWSHTHSIRWRSSWQPCRFSIPGQRGTAIEGKCCLLQIRNLRAKFRVSCCSVPKSPDPFFQVTSLACFQKNGCSLQNLFTFYTSAQIQCFLLQQRLLRALKSHSFQERLSKSYCVIC